MSPATDSERHRLGLVQPLVAQALDIERAFMRREVLGDVALAELLRTYQQALVVAAGDECDLKAWAAALFVFEPQVAYADEGIDPDHYLRQAHRRCPGRYVAREATAWGPKLKVQAEALLGAALYAVADVTRGIRSDAYPIPHLVPGCCGTIELTEPLFPASAVEPGVLFIDSTASVVRAHPDELDLAPLARQWIEVLASCDALCLCVSPVIEAARSRPPGGLLFGIGPENAISMSGASREFRARLAHDLTLIARHLAPFLATSSGAIGAQPQEVEGV